MLRKTALVLTGGGARGAYQAGVLKAMAEILPKNYFPFPIITGISAGSINAAFLACHEGSFQDSAARLWAVWDSLASKDIFVQQKAGLVTLAFKILSSSIFQGLLVGKWPTSILDNEPLRKLLEHHIHPETIKKHIEKGNLLGVALSATDFVLGITTTFFEAHSSLKEWQEVNRKGVLTTIDIDHVMASSALPLIFKLVKIGNIFYGDGSTRVNFPLVPAIKLKATSIVGIDMRFPTQACQSNACIYPALDTVVASLLDSLFSDALDQDINRLNLINTLIEQKGELKSYRKIPFMLFRPSRDPALLAQDIYDDLSKPLKRTLHFLGVSKGHSQNLISHLAFESVYTKKLLALGYDDVFQKKHDFLNFMAMHP